MVTIGTWNPRSATDRMCMTDFYKDNCLLKAGQRSNVSSFIHLLGLALNRLVMYTQSNKFWNVSCAFEPWGHCNLMLKHFHMINVLERNPFSYEKMCINIFLTEAPHVIATMESFPTGNICPGSTKVICSNQCMRLLCKTVGLNC